MTSSFKSNVFFITEYESIFFSEIILFQLYKTVHIVFAINVRNSKNTK